MLRPALLSDLDALLGIESRAFSGNRLSPRAMRAAILNPRAHMIVAQDGSRVTGYGLLFYRKNCGFARLYSLAVDPVFRGQGIARHLLEGLSEGCTAPMMSLEVRDDNAPAIALYRALGFSQSSRRENYYDDGAAALIMRKTL